MKAWQMFAATAALHVAAAALGGDNPAAIGVFLLGLVQGVVLVVYMFFREEPEDGQ